MVIILSECVFGNILCKNQDDTVREYFVIAIGYYSFYKWIFNNNWKILNEKYDGTGKVCGYYVTVERKRYADKDN